jgi:FtsP/CotA-like multicopper oxidase with cupredoxin domain
MNWKKLKLTRRQILKAGLIGAAGMMVPWRWIGGRKVYAVPAAAGLSDPALQPKFVNLVPDALMPGFKYSPVGMGRGGVQNYRVGVGFNPNHMTGLRNADDTAFVPTPIFGYGQDSTYTWPGMTFEVQAGRPTQVQWRNNLSNVTQHLLPVDTSLHWCYSLHGFENRSIENDGVPIVVHLHGGHTTDLFDGNPEQFFTPGWKVRGPRFRGRTSTYQNDRPAGNLWYHDHALGITRLNVYAGMAGFYFVRDDIDTGTADNPLNLPAWPYEKAYAIQDRMFKATGELFYPAFPGDPFYDDFIETPLPDPPFVGGGPTALAEFFGDHMVVNGLIWPKEDVEPRNYRLHLLNGTDSRFMVIQFVAVNAGVTDPNDISASDPLDFYVIGSDQGLASGAAPVTQLVSEPGSRYDIVFDFSDPSLAGRRIIMKNIGGDAPFGGAFGDDLEPEDVFPDRQTDRIMAFDVVLALNELVDEDRPDNFDPADIGPYSMNNNAVTRTRKVALFEGMDEFERLQPLLGTAEPATSFNGKPINWPNTQPYIDAGLIGQMEGSIAWHSPTTENPALNATEEWEIYNATGDAHPIHLHLVHFDGIERREFTADVGDQPVVQHNGELGSGFKLSNIVLGSTFIPPEGYVENAPKDMVTALPSQDENTGQMTKIKVTFDKPGRYVWHCHILSHEDHEMMRVLHVGGGA